MSPASAFDGVHPPSNRLIDACVHCGFCLPSCPTYALWGEEMDSPRGRIYLMKAGLEGRAGMAPSFVQHFDACLGCMACVTACPSGVQYAPLIEATRGQIERRFDRSFADRVFRAAIFALFPHPRRLRIALLPLVLWTSVVRRSTFAVRRAGFGVRGSSSADERRARHDEPRTSNDAPSTTHVARRTTNDARLLPRIRAMLALAPDVTWQSLFASVPARTPATGSRRMTVGLLTGCVQRVVFPHVNQATVNVLAAEGCDVVAPAAQGCCGALALHAGRLDEARAGGFSARVRDVTEIVASLGPPRAVRHPLALRIAYHDACHLAHAQGVRQPPRDLLRSIPGVELLTFAEQETCCGSAGIYNLVEPDAARQLGDRKASHIAAVQPDVVATANPGCMLQMAAGAARRGETWPVLHPIELVDASIRGSLLPRMSSASDSV